MNPFIEQGTLSNRAKWVAQYGDQIRDAINAGISWQSAHQVLLKQDVQISYVSFTQTMQRHYPDLKKKKSGSSKSSLTTTPTQTPNAVEPVKPVNAVEQTEIEQSEKDRAAAEEEKINRVHQKLNNISRKINRSLED